MLSATALSEVAISTARDKLMVASAAPSASLEIIPPIFTLVTDERSILLCAIEIYPGLSPDRVVSSQEDGNTYLADYDGFILATETDDLIIVG